MDLLVLTLFLGYVSGILILIPAFVNLIVKKVRSKRLLLRHPKHTPKLKFHSIIQGQIVGWIIIKDEVYDVTSYVEEQIGLLMTRLNASSGHNMLLVSLT